MCYNRVAGWYQATPRKRKRGNENITNEQNENLGKIGAEQAILNNTSIPAFYIHNEKQASLLIDYIKSSHLIDVFVITDADIAAEASNFTQQQILQQVSTSLLAQANQAPSIALSLV